MFISPVAGPQWWQRQAGATGLTWSDRSLVQNYANDNIPAQFMSEQAPADPHPETFLVKKYGLMTSDHHHQHVHSYENRNKVSQAYWAKSVLDPKQ